MAVKKTEVGVPASDLKILEDLRSFRENFFKQISRKIVGNETIILDLLTALLAGGNVLLIGVPGLGKTLLVKSISELLGLHFSRIQFTPDLMPSDITGSELLEEGRSGKRAFRFIEGPVFANIILADEINRTPPRTQSALLQAMEELSVSVGTKTYELEKPFFVLATQNPIEQEGTYPLPEAQLDRFIFSLNLEYPSFEEELSISLLNPEAKSISLKSISNAKQILSFQKMVNRVPVASALIEDIVNIVQKTRDKTSAPGSYFEYGAGPRASQAIVAASRALALLEGDFAVDKTHIRRVAKKVLRHRIILNFQALGEGLSADDLLDILLEDLK